ncbi:unnamed protein product [Plasmodium vivax]|uniref:(malaria parasite P. vivax) hypothetical protein n=1 Tax=Plasmodium vivax TaxID=5855 RepID=A0A8S4HCI3_PLAVI|nr:unnamed protein product [Plasmodium vivax]
MRIIFPGCEAKNSWCACLLYIALITKYDVFDYLDVYENLDYQISTKYVSYQEATFCDNVDFDKNSNFELRKICKRFVMFFKKCFIQYPDNSFQSNNSKYPEYINYWLSYKLDKSPIYDTFKNSFYEKIKGYCDKFKAEYKLRDKIFPIDNNSFINMSTLYKLYKKYHEEKGKKDIKCIDFPNDWKSECNTCLYKCYLHGNKRLCDAIKRFRDNYETNKSTIKPACNRDERNSLPDITCEEIDVNLAEVWNKLGTSLEEKFTPIGSWLCKKRKKNEKTSSKVRKVKIQDSLENIADFENVYPKNIRIRLKYHNM